MLQELKINNYPEFSYPARDGRYLVAMTNSGFFIGDNMSRKINLIGERIGRLTVMQEIGKTKDNHILWECLCDCGKTTNVRSTHLKRKAIRSCGCLQKEKTQDARTTHGRSRTSEYRIWSDMKRRCYNPKTQYYPIYGGRGIIVCEKWHNFENFYKDMGPRPSNRHSIERKDPNSNYEPDNCIWATNRTQARNTRIRKDNKSGVAGVYKGKNCNKYIAYIAVDSKNIYLGSFLTINEAAKARKAGELKYWGGENAKE